MDDVFKIIIGAFFLILVIGCGVILFNQPTKNVVDDATIADVIEDKVSDFKDGGSVNITNNNQNVTYTISSSKTNSNSNSNSNNANANNNNGKSSYSISSNDKDTVTNVAVGSEKSESGVSAGHVVKNSHEDKGYYYQINYNDGNFRQYDTKTGNLIGSTFDEYQAKLSITGGQLV